MTEDSEDKLMRYLTRSNADEVRQAILEYRSRLSKRTPMNPNVLKRMLKEHGWTMSEYTKAVSK